MEEGVPLTNHLTPRDNPDEGKIWAGVFNVSDLFELYCSEPWINKTSS
jgi:hypothetical protein